MDWTTPLAVLGWLFVGIAGLSVVTFFIALFASLRGVREMRGVREHRAEPVSTAFPVAELTPECPHCGPDACPILNNFSYKSGL